MDELKPCPDISKMVEDAEIKLCDLADEWKETLQRQYDYATYDKNTGLWKHGDPTRVECARYSLLAYQNAAKIVADLGQAIDNMSRTQPENKPLNLEELRQMDGEPYWHKSLTGHGDKWVILDPFIANHPEEYHYGKTWLAYTHKPEEEK